MLKFLKDTIGEEEHLSSGNSILCIKTVLLPNYFTDVLLNFMLLETNLTENDLLF